MSDIPPIAIAVELAAHQKSNAPHDHAFRVVN
jgi:hypothetical protein